MSEEGRVELDERLAKVREETKAMFKIMFKHDSKLPKFREEVSE